MLSGLKIKFPSFGGSIPSSRIDLPAVLSAIGKSARRSRWRCSRLHYTAKVDGKFREIRDEGKRLSGDELAAFASKFHQLINGRFEAYFGKRVAEPWLILLAVDGGWLEVWSAGAEALERLKADFDDATDLSDPASLTHPDLCRSA